ncbi:protein lifeguard 3 isoform X2 [Biomphalaria glabrata]|nr:protein lifeguard 3 isoform X2 [Biomphalaria glabrata]
MASYNQHPPPVDNAPPPYGYGVPASNQYGVPANNQYGVPANNQYGVPANNQGGYPQPPPPGFNIQSDPYNHGYDQFKTDSQHDPEAAVAVPKATDDWNAGSFSDKTIRRRFILKVYAILFAQLLVTFGTICLFIFVKPIKLWVQNNLWFYICAYVLFLVLYLTLICCPNVRRKYPNNFICLGLFTLVFSYMTGTISSFHSTEIVLIAAGITAAICLAISLFAVQTKIDFTLCSGLLFVLVMALFFFGWSCLIVYYALGYNYILECVYGGLAALVFGLFLIYDTQHIVGGRKYELSPEEYIYGALQLYLDIVNLFIILLGLMGKK